MTAGARLGLRFLHAEIWSYRHVNTTVIDFYKPLDHFRLHHMRPLTTQFVLCRLLDIELLSRRIGSLDSCDWPRILILLAERIPDDRHRECAVLKYLIVDGI